ACMQVESRPRPIQPIKFGTQVVLVIGFGGLLAMMALAGVDSINVLVRIQARNFEIRQNFLTRERALEEVRAGIYISGTNARDYLLERDAAAAEGYRATLQAARKQVEAALASYSRSLAPEQTSSFDALESEIQSYWRALEPIFHWDAAEKKARSESFMH